MTLDEILQDIHALEEDMLVFERKYGVLTETFYESYIHGEEPAGRCVGRNRVLWQLPVTVRERLTFDTGPLVLRRYGYEVWRGDEKLSWYDSQPHPLDPSLVATDPHHKYIPPDIKNHRIPAPELFFTRPNLPFLIREVEQVLAARET